MEGSLLGELSEAAALAAAAILGLALGFGGAILGYRKLGTRVVVEAGIIGSVSVFLVLYLPFPWWLLVLAASVLLQLGILGAVVMKRAVDFTLEPLPNHLADPVVLGAVPALEALGFHRVTTLRLAPNNLPPTDIVLLLREDWRTLAAVHAIRDSGDVRVALESPFGDGRLTTTTSSVVGSRRPVTWSMPTASQPELFDAHTRALRWAADAGADPDPVTDEDVVTLFRRWEDEDVALVRDLSLFGLATFVLRNQAPKAAPWDQPGALGRLTG